MNYICVDLETGTKEKYKRKGNPWYNEIVAIGLCKFKQSRADYYTDPAFKRWVDYLNCEIIVGHNIKFDLLYLWKSEYLQTWLQQGGKIWDTQLVEFILSGQQHKFPALRDIAVNKYGCKEREKKMEAYWEDNSKILNQNTKEIIKTFPSGTSTRDMIEYCDQNNIKGSVDFIQGSIDTKDIPKELVLEDVRNDVLDTEQVYLKQLELVKQEGMEELVAIHNECLLATIEMEANGLFVDKTILNKNELELEKQYHKCLNEIQEIVKRYV